MNEKDAFIHKMLVELDMTEETPLSDEEEYALRYATDADFRFSEDIAKLYTKSQTREN